MEIVRINHSIRIRWFAEHALSDRPATENMVAVALLGSATMHIFCDDLKSMAFHRESHKSGITSESIRP